MGKNSGNKWQQYEIDFLKKNYISSEKDFILENISRSWSSIICKAHELQIKRDYPKEKRPKTKYNNEDIKEIVEQSFIELELKYIDGEYINQDSRLFLIDKYKYKYDLSLSNIRSAKRAKSEPMKFGKSNKYTIDNFNNYLSLNNKNFKVYEEKYMGLNHNMRMICGEGHEFYKNRSFIYYGYDCPECENVFDYSYEKMKLY